MKYLVLGGCGIQGRTVVHDLASDPEVSEVICADLRFDELSKIAPFTNMEKIRTAPVDAKDVSALAALFAQSDMVIDLLPKIYTVCQSGGHQGKGQYRQHQLRLSS